MCIMEKTHNCRSGNIAATFIVSFGVVGGPEKDRLSTRVGRKVTLRQ